MTIQLFSLIGALAILAAFAGSQFRWMSPTGLFYLLLNTTGGGLLAVIACLEQQWGFLLLEIVWTLVSLYALIRLINKGPVAT